MLQQDWVKEWEGWVDAQILWHSDDDDMIHNIAEDIVIGFFRISMNNVRVRHLSDEMRQQDLRKQGFYIGKVLRMENNTHVCWIICYNF